MKRANGTGGVIKRGGNRRRPYEARITTGHTPEGKQIVKVIGYYNTRDEALDVLLDYNKSPYDIDAKRITMAELYDRWRSRAVLQGRLSMKTIQGINNGYLHCKDLHGMAYSFIKTHMMQSCVDNCGRGYGTQKQIKSLFYHLDNYGIEFDVIQKRYSDLITTDSVKPKQKKPFSDSEVKRLWDNVDKPWVDTILILLYSGWRVSEMLGLLTENVIIDNPEECINYMRGGIKTEAGENRVVPIHSAILPLVKKRYNPDNKYLIEFEGKLMTYAMYRYYFFGVMDKLKMKHTVHETRHTFRSWLNRTPAKLSCINRIMGHRCKDIGLEVYTHDTLEDLRYTIEFIKIHTNGLKIGR
jgi:site-specific recombinase XerD